MSAKNSTSGLKQSDIFRFWVPLASTWIMMALEVPMVTALIARLAEPKMNLAAFGVAFSIALVAEAPIMMILAAATALVRGENSYRKLRFFSQVLSCLMTIIMIVVLYPGAFSLIADDLLSLPPEVALLTRNAAILMIPWPLAIGYRRFYQGILIRYGRTRAVATGTFIRLIGTAIAAFSLYYFTDLSGAIMGACTISIAVLIEAAVARVMAGEVIRGQIKDLPVEDDSLTFGEIFKFFYPLATTSFLALSAHPMITYFVSLAPNQINSLAVIPVINGFVFLFRSLTLSYQEVIIAQLSNNIANLRAVKTFALMLSGVLTAIYLIVVNTPLASLWFEGVSGLTPELSSFAYLPATILFLIPAASIWVIWQRSLLVVARTTAVVTYAMIFELLVIATVFFSCMKLFPDLAGATLAAVAIATGRIASGSALLIPARKAKSSLVL